MRHALDWSLIVAYLLAAALSLAVIFSISPERLGVQAVSLGIGFFILVYLSRQDYAFFQAVGWPSYILTVLMLAATLALGENVRGSVRWINIAGFQFQASEFTKPLLILAFSHFMTRYPPKTLKNMAINTALFLLPVLLIFRQPDLGTALVIASIWSAIFLVSAWVWWILGGSAVIAVAGVLIAPRFLHDYQIARLTSFLNPAGDPLGSGYNVIQSIIAVGSGGFFGKGLGHGTQSHLRFLPERHTDFIFASLAEELGLLGGCAVVAVLSFLMYRLLSIGARTDNSTNRMICAGIFGFLAFQTFVNIGMNIGIAPVTGITLPLISYGGSSAIATGVCLGIAGSMSRSLKREVSIEIR